MSKTYTYLMVVIGAGLALVTAQVYGRLRATRMNGWLTMPGCGVPGNGMFLRAAQAWVFTSPIASPQEAVYWWANPDGSVDIHLQSTAPAGHEANWLPTPAAGFQA